MDCLKNIIGITQTPCDCIASELPVDYMVSDSGLYMDELPEFPINLRSIKSIEECGLEFGTILTKSIENAKNVFKVELFKHLQTRYQSPIKPFTGNVGAMSYSRALEIDSEYAGVSLRTAGQRGVMLSVSKILTSLDTTADFNVDVYKGAMLLKSIPVKSTAGAIIDNALFDPLELPMADEYGQAIEYSFIYQRGAMLPKDHLVDCNCGNKEVEMRKYFTHQGIVGDIPANVLDFQKTQYVNGLILFVDVRCDSNMSICKAYNDNEAIRTAISWSVLRKTVELLITNMLFSKVINRDTMADREQMQYRAYALAKRFNNDVQWIAENIDLSETECFICNQDNNGYRKSGILA